MVFFDLYGILIDTGAPHVEAERATIRDFGFDDLAEDHPVTFGHGVIPGSKMIATHYGIDDAEALLAEYLNSGSSGSESPPLEPTCCQMRMLECDQ